MSGIFNQKVGIIRYAFLYRIRPPGNRSSLLSPKAAAPDKVIVIAAGSQFPKTQGYFRPPQSSSTPQGT